MQMTAMHDAKMQYPRRALVCVLGRSPQILTETLYALCRQSQPAWIPTEIHVITTASGADEVRGRLLSSSEPRLLQLVEAYVPPAMGSIAFDASESHLHIISSNGQALDDIDDPDDSAAAGNTILEVLTPLVSDPDCEIHASIAGGRKTMGALLMSAMSLLGRPQDRVSHLLIAQRLENHPDFYFPPKTPVNLTLSDGSVVSTADADIRLAMVPLLRFAVGLRSRILESGRTYEELVQEAEQQLLPEPVVITLAERRVGVGFRAVQLEPAMMAWYAHLAQRRFLRLQEPGLVAPGMVRVGKDPDRFIGLAPSDLHVVFARMPKSRFKLPSRVPGLFEAEFRSRVSDINGTLRDGLGEAIAQRLVVVGPGDRKRRDSQYGLLNLDPGLIRIV